MFKMTSFAASFSSRRAGIIFAPAREFPPDNPENLFRLTRGREKRGAEKVEDEVEEEEKKKKEGKIDPLDTVDRRAKHSAVSLPRHAQGEFNPTEPKDGRFS